MTSPTDRVGASTSDGLDIAFGLTDGAMVVRVCGALRFPAAVQLTTATKAHFEHGVTEVTVLDLSALDDMDHTGVAVLVAVARDLKAAGSQVRIVAANRAITARLPYTLGLRRIFATTEDALTSTV